MLHDYSADLEAQLDATIATAQETITLNTGGKNLLASLRRQGYAIVRSDEVQPIPEQPPTAPAPEAQG